MQIQKEVLPVKCNKCGDIFDLSYDVSIDEPMFQEFIEIMRHKKVNFGLLCWDCR